MKIVITGASGFVGSLLIPLLEREGVSLLLVGRDVLSLQRKYPNSSVCNYEELLQKASGYHVLVHLAVLNNNREASFEDYRSANVDHLLRVAAISSQAKIPHFLNVSSTHALDIENASAYARSKREGALQLSKYYPNSTSIYLALAYGEAWGGKMIGLNKLPRGIARAIFSVMSAVRPTSHVELLSSFILSLPDTVNRANLILSDGQDNNRIYKIVRRLVDISFSLGVIILFWWFLLLVWFVIKLDSPGPGLFIQRRVGRHGQEFMCFKFRTMQSGTSEMGTHEVLASSITRVGHVLRRLKIDELPQVWNLLRSNMSLVGPRPCLPNQVRIVQTRREAGLLALKPGITGYSQVAGIDMSNAGLLARSDSEYKALQSLSLDAKIILRTAIGRGRGDPAANNAKPNV